MRLCGVMSRFLSLSSHANAWAWAQTSHLSNFSMRRDDGPLSNLRWSRSNEARRSLRRMWYLETCTPPPRLGGKIRPARVPLWRSTHDIANKLHIFLCNDGDMTFIYSSKHTSRQYADLLGATCEYLVEMLAEQTRGWSRYSRPRILWS